MPDELGSRNLWKLLNYRREHKTWQEELDKDAPKTGDLAPDFTLYDTTGEEAVTLSAFHENRPVVLVFGSFT